VIIARFLWCRETKIADLIVETPEIERTEISTNDGEPLHRCLS